MSYLKTVVTYHQPSEAEIDKAFLESHGFEVCLLNANTARNELGAAFFIQLQVMEEDHARAVAVLREFNPSRFGSPARAQELERQFLRSVALFFLGAVPLGLAAYFLTPAVAWTGLAGWHDVRTLEARPFSCATAALIGGALAVKFGKRKSLEKRASS